MRLAFACCALVALVSPLAPRVASAETARPPMPAEPAGDEAPTTTASPELESGEPATTRVSSAEVPPPRAVPPEAPRPGPRDEDEDDRRVYLSISPLHLLAPVVELTGEVRVHRKIGVAAIGGYGAVRAEPGGPRFSVWEVGGQFVGYPVGHFDHGMQLGAEVLYVGVSGADGAGSVKVSGAGDGLAAGPFVGYKLATKVGFSFNVQGGVQYMMARAEASSTSGATASASDSRVIPLLNINAGWSF